MENAAITIAGEATPPGKRRQLEIPVAHLPTHTALSLPLIVVNGSHAGPTIFLSAAIHGDEINGVEIIQQVLERISAKKLHGAILAIPIVNVFGFIHHSRYLPDRRDLNRCFPGSPRGSLASRLAHLFIREIVDKCAYGIDFHTASAPRTNLPQIRANLKDKETAAVATAFAAPVMIHANIRDGSLRQAAMHRGVRILLYEAGEPLRFNNDAIEVGVQGTFRVLTFLQMYNGPLEPTKQSIEITSTKWLRAHRSGVLRLSVELGETVEKRQRLGAVADILGKKSSMLFAPFDGIIIGHTQNPLVYQGDAVIHIAKLS